MTKIVKMRLENFKAIDIREMTFNGASAIITGGNNKGKTSFLRGLMDRIRFDRPKIKVHQGQKEGSGEMVLDSGEKFVWDFDDEGRDKLTFISQEGTKANVTKELGAKFFPKLFDIDRFIESTPADQVKQLQRIVGLDFTDIDKRADEAYKHRYRCNEESERYRVKLSQLMKCDPVTPVDVELLNIKRREAKASQDKERARLNEQYLANKKKNDDTLAQWESDKYHIDSNHDIEIKAWEQKKMAIDKGIREHNDTRNEASAVISRSQDALEILVSKGYTGSEVRNWIAELIKSMPELKEAVYPERPVKSAYPERPETPDPMPSREELDKLEKVIEAIDTEILAATDNNVKAKDYKDYVEYIKEVEAAKTAAVEAEEAYQVIMREKKEMIAGANFPAGISISSEPIGVTVDGLPLDRNQLSTSKLYTAALRIAAMNLGEVRALHFDCSYLDKNSLSEVNDWAVANDLQLLIERVDANGGEIQYTIIE